MNSLDPRINRLDLQRGKEATVPEKTLWQTYEVFHQAIRGKQHSHVGSVHAPDPELALVFAKEQFGRRQKCSNLWVVKTSNVFSFQYEDEDMFFTVPEKIHREAAGYKVRDKIEEFKKKQSVSK